MEGWRDGGMEKEQNKSRRKRFGNSLAVGIEDGMEEGRVEAERERGQDRRETGGSKGVNYKGTNVESADQLLAKPVCKSNA